MAIGKTEYPIIYAHYAILNVKPAITKYNASAAKMVIITNHLINLVLIYVKRVFMLKI